MILSTIGYEAATLAEVIARLRAAGVEVVVDVRAVAASRRAGFSKTVLRASLRPRASPTSTCGARHPQAGAGGGRRGRITEMEAIFAEHMRTPEAQDALALAVAIARERPAALLCFEACARDATAGSSRT
jgi:uncharacterized protein (DUF488 family)